MGVAVSLDTLDKIVPSILMSVNHHLAKMVSGLLRADLIFPMLIGGVKFE